MSPAGTCFDRKYKLPVGTCRSKLLISDHRNRLGDDNIRAAQYLKSSDEVKTAEVMEVKKRQDMLAALERQDPRGI